MADFSYELFTGPLESDPYESKILPIRCNSYTISSLFNSMPSFVSQSTDTVIVDSNERAHIGDHMIDVVVTMEVPQDYLMTEYKTQEMRTNFTVTVFDRCE